MAESSEHAPRALLPSVQVITPQVPNPWPAFHHDDEVHVWCLQRGGEALDLDILAPNERARFDAMRSAAARDDFAACRIALRRLLAHYLARPADSLDITCVVGEKPAILNASGIHFNYSHTPGLAVIVIAPRGPLGVDVEALDTPRNIAAIAKRYFSPGELAFLRATPEDLQSVAFLRLWTAKEALLKASGEGLHGLQRADLASPPANLHLTTFQPTSAHIATLAGAPGFQPAFFCLTI